MQSNRTLSSPSEPPTPSGRMWSISNSAGASSWAQMAHIPAPALTRARRNRLAAPPAPRSLSWRLASVDAFHLFRKLLAHSVQRLRPGWVGVPQVRHGLGICIEPSPLTPTRGHATGEAISGAPELQIRAGQDVRTCPRTSPSVCVPGLRSQPRGPLSRVWRGIGGRPGTSLRWEALSPSCRRQTCRARCGRAGRRLGASHCRAQRTSQ